MWIKLKNSHIGIFTDCDEKVDGNWFMMAGTSNKNAQNINHFFITNHQRLLKASPRPSHDSLQRTSPADKKLTLHHWHHVLQSAVALQYKVKINTLCRDKILRWFQNQIIREQSLGGVKTVPRSVYGCFLFLTLERRKNGVINVSIYKMK